MMNTKKSITDISKEEDNQIRIVPNMIFKKLRIMDQDYSLSLNYHSRNPDFQKTLIEVQKSLTQELYGDEVNKPLPEKLTFEVASEIREFAKENIEKVLAELREKITDVRLLQEEIAYEGSKLDDIIYIKYGFFGVDVTKAFQKYNLLTNGVIPQSDVSSPQTNITSSAPAFLHDTQ